jgi:AAA domain|tara:strand:- start:2664 stop:3134 length:471 start_codon:yes stop_codon:yes gene_type:complete
LVVTHANHQVIEAELHVIVNSLRQLQQQPAFTAARTVGGNNKNAKVSMISPCRKVKNACIMRIKDAGLRQIECGTVHTFQGKDAGVVFLALGTAPGQAGSNARAWASGKPNPLHVAITRTKCCFCVIGDAAQRGPESLRQCTCLCPFARHFARSQA